MEEKNPFLAGLFNMLVPGSAYWYVDKDRARFLRALMIGITAFVAMIVLGSILQRAGGFPLPQSMCPAMLLLVILIPLFLSGQKVAKRHNSMRDKATNFNARQLGTDEDQLAKNQDLRDKGMISKQEYDSRKDSINRKN